MAVGLVHCSLPTARNLRLVHAGPAHPQGGLRQDPVLLRAGRAHPGVAVSAGGLHAQHSDRSACNLGSARSAACMAQPCSTLPQTSPLPAPLPCRRWGDQARMEAAKVAADQQEAQRREANAQRFEAEKEERREEAQLRWVLESGTPTEEGQRHCADGSACVCYRLQ